MALILCATTILNLLGCGGSAGPKEPQATASGSVVYDDKPIMLDSRVIFYCKDKTVSAYGKVDSLGKFTLQPSNPEYGIPSGRYQIMILPPEAPPPEVGSADYLNAMQGKVKPAEPDSVTGIPSMFRNFDTSNLVVEMKTGDNTFDFDLAKLQKK